MQRNVLNRFFTMMCVLLWLGAASFMFLQTQHAFAHDKDAGTAQAIKLPPPRMDGPISVEKALSERRTVRVYKEDPLTLADLSQLLWAAQGITEPKRGLRTAPSATAAYLLNTYVVSGNVTNLPVGMYKYAPKDHSLMKIAEGDKKTELFNAVGQVPIKNAPALIVFSGMSERSKRVGWMYLEAGAASQNMHLEAVTMGLGTVTIAGFKDDDVRRVLNLGQNEQPIYIMPVGRQ
jgi:SagB-type dehydrogenase family enzyme